MKKVLLLLSLVVLTSSFSEEKVYVCNSAGAKRYHLDKDCRGLKNCKSEIKEVTLGEAKKDGKTLCGYED